MRKIIADPAIDKPCLLGEGPVWHDETFWWVDILEKRLHRCRPPGNEIVSTALPEPIGFAVPANDGTWRIGLQSGIYSLDVDSGDLALLHNPEPDLPENRFNDGKTDPWGRLWAGTMSMNSEKETGSLYRLSGGACDAVLAPVTISNGLAWDRERLKMYYIDTPTREVAVFDYNPEDGRISNRQTAFRVPEGTGSPDGMTIDAEGKLWVALWGGQSVIQIDPEKGKQILRVEVPAPNVTSCTFGGNNLSELYITTARAGLSPEQLEAFPHAGSIFTVRTNTRGNPVDVCHS